MTKIIITNQKTTNGLDHQTGERVGIGYGNHDPNRSTVLHQFDKEFDTFTGEKSLYDSKDEFMKQVMVPAFENAGSTNPEGMARNIYGMLVREGKIIEVDVEWNHQVEEYHFKDGSIYVAPRSDDRTDDEIIYHGKNHSGGSPVYEAIRSDLYDFKRVIKKQLSKGKAEATAKRLMDYYRSIGRKVLNVRGSNNNESN